MTPRASPRRRILDFPRFRDDSSGVSTTAGTNCGASELRLAAGSRACRRHVKSCCGVNPCRRATWQAVAPSTKLSATIDAFSSGVQERRRPAPVNTSSRCAGLKTSDTCLWSEIDMCRSSHQGSDYPISHRQKTRWDQSSAYDQAMAASAGRGAERRWDTAH